MPAKTKRPTAAESKRRQELTFEIMQIAEKQFRQSLDAANARYNTIDKRLASIEQHGAPQSAVQQMMTKVSGLVYVVQQQKQAIEGLLSFFKMSEKFIGEVKK